jgi:hypothetical protein
LLPKPLHEFGRSRRPVRVVFEPAVGAVIFGHVITGGARIAVIGCDILVVHVAVGMPVTVQPIVMVVLGSVDGIHLISTGKPSTASTGKSVTASRLPQRLKLCSHRL